MEEERKKVQETPATTIRKALRCFGYGFLIRFVFSMLANKLRIIRVLSWGKGGSLKGIIRFASFSGMISLIYKAARYLMKIQGWLEESLDKRVFISALLSSFSLFILERRDLEILKVLIYPRLCESLYTLSVEKGFIKPIPHGETFVAWFTALAIAYSYIYEPANISYSFVR